LFRDPDESSVSITHEEPEISNCPDIPDIEQDPDISLPNHCVPFLMGQLLKSFLTSLASTF